MLDGYLKGCPIFQSIKFPYKNTYNPGTIDNVCKVIVHNKHPIDIADEFSAHGFNSLISPKPIPAIIYPMGIEFIGTNIESREGIYDENTILRTNYPFVIKKQTDLFPIKDGVRTVVYSNPITLVRDSNYNFLNVDKLCKFAIITVCYQRKHELLVQKIKNDGTNNDSETESNHKNHDKHDKHQKYTENKMLTSSDLLNFQIVLENAFQAAIGGFHDILILPIFRIDFGILPPDQILIFNMCIMKFSHKFKGIMICVPPYEGTDTFEYFNQNIIKPNILIKEIDMKYTADLMAKRLNDETDETGDTNDTDNKKNIKVKKTIDINKLNDDDKIKELRKQVKANKEKQLTKAKNHRAK